MGDVYELWEILGVLEKGREEKEKVIWMRQNIC